MSKAVHGMKTINGSEGKVSRINSAQDEDEWSTRGRVSQSDLYRPSLMDDSRNEYRDSSLISIVITLAVTKMFTHKVPRREDT